MHKAWLAVAMMFVVTGCGIDADSDDATSEFDVFAAYSGFVDLYWDESGGRLLIRIKDLEEPFLYQSSLPRGVGSNDLGLDRGQLGPARIVSFERSGPKVLLIEHNLAFRARSDDANERQAVEESFARSVIWGFEVVAADRDALVIDGTDFFLRDAHGIGGRLLAREESNSGATEFKVDTSRSAIYLPRTKAFPDNTEIEATVTLVGRAIGPHLPTVTPDSSAVTVHMHHSFIRLPDDNYVPLPYEPRSGVQGRAVRE